MGKKKKSTDDIIHKPCPKCGAHTMKIKGSCNYIKCKNPYVKCGAEWCFECGKEKFTECNNSSHKSH